MRFAFLLLGAVACDAATGTNTNTDTNTTTEPDPTGTTGPVDCNLAYPGSGARCAELTRDGTGIASPADAPVSYEGTETVRFTSEFGYGPVICEFNYSVTSTAVRDDCPGACGTDGWAFDVVLGDATVEANTDDACDRVFEIFEITAAEDLNGQATTRAYDPDFISHAQVLLIYDDVEQTWNGATFLQYDNTTGVANYLDWFDGVYDY